MNDTNNANNAPIQMGARTRRHPYAERARDLVRLTLDAWVDAVPGDRIEVTVYGVDFTAQYLADPGVWSLHYR